MASVVSTFGANQRAADLRELESAKQRKAAEKKFEVLEEEKAQLAAELTSRASGIASLTAEISLLKSQAS